MGNCAPKPKTRSKASVSRSKVGAPIVRLYGSETCPTACRIRVSLLYKSVAVEFIASEIPSVGRPFIQCGSDTVSAPADSMLRYIDSKFAGPPAAVEWAEEVVAAVVALQHRSMERHVEGIERWARDLVKGEGRGRVEGRRMGEWYGRLVELMLEHAQMEERFLFPALERAVDSDLCKEATEEHGRDLPIMNGIKEDIKSLVVMEAGTPFYQEALLNLSLRFKTLQEHCKEHFKEEERKLLPLLNLAERIRREEGEEPWSPLRWAEQVMGLMESTHSHLFPFFMAGLLPYEAMQYIDLVCRCTSGNPQRVVMMLRSLASWIEGTPPLSWIKNTPFLKSC